MITQARIRELFDYDSNTGDLTRKTSFNRWKAGDKVGFKNTDGYIEAGVDGVYYGAHRIAWIYVHGDEFVEEVDHLNGIRDDNRIENLRKADKSINAQNKRVARSDSKSGLLGVCWHKATSKWIAQIQVSGKKTHIGVFETADSAHEAYITSKRLLHTGNTL